MFTPWNSARPIHKPIYVFLVDWTNSSSGWIYNAFPHSPHSEEKTPQKSQPTDCLSTESLEKAEHLNSFLEEHKASDCAEKTYQKQPEGEQSLADGSSTSPVISSSGHFSPLSPFTSSYLPSTGPLKQGEENNCALASDTQTGETLENIQINFKLAP